LAPMTNAPGQGRRGPGLEARETSA
jgi:hypothetical protein